jgi:simple sugar transport system ATP-binding protein
VFDEPTATLSVQEIQEFIKLMNTLRNKGVSIIFISHKLKEVKEVADRVVILNKGKFMGSHINNSQLTIDKIAKLMVGADVKLAYPKRKLSSKKILELKDISARDKKTKKQYLDKVSFDVREGEIFGLAGIEGNGQEEIIEIVSGLRKADNGTITFKGDDITNMKVSQRNDFMSHIATDRFKHAIVPLETLAFNSMFTSLNDPRFSKLRVIRNSKKNGIFSSTI